MIVQSVAIERNEEGEEKKFPIGFNSDEVAVFFYLPPYEGRERVGVRLKNGDMIVLDESFREFQNKLAGPDIRTSSPTGATGSRRDFDK